MKTVMAFGTFDKVHPGHVSYLKQAKKLGDTLVVVVARDKNVKMIKSRLPRMNEQSRKKAIQNLKIADRVVLGQIRDRLAVIRKYRPDIICLGYDQQADIGKLRAVFRGKIVRAKALKPDVYKSSRLVD